MEITMRIDKLYLQDFGQFHNKDVTLQPGINVIYGANEAGKSTMKDFIVDMMYGIDKNQDGTGLNHYNQKKPINGTSFSGAMEVTTDTNRYFLQRNFDEQSKNTVVRDIVTGGEVSLHAPHDIKGVVLNTDRATYMNTLCIGQMGAHTDSAIAERLNQYIVNMASTRTGDVDVVNAIMELKNKQKEFSNEEYLAKEQELTAQLDLEKDYDGELAAVVAEREQLEKEIGSGSISQLQFSPIHTKKEDEVVASEEENAPVAEEPKESSESVDEETVEEEETVKKKKSKKGKNKKKNQENLEGTEEKVSEVPDKKAIKRAKDMEMLRNMGPRGVLDNIFVILFLGLLLMALFVGISYVIPTNVAEIKMAVMLVGVIFVAITWIQILVRRANLYTLLEEMEIEQNFEEAQTETPALKEDAKQSMVNRVAELKAKEYTIEKEKRTQEELLEQLSEVKAKMQANDIEVAALELAINTIQDLSEEIYDSFGMVLNDKVSEIVSRITKGKYSEVKIDDQLRVMVKHDNSYISMEYLSTGTMEQIYLALRLSIANVLIKEDLPIILDDIFVTYDYQRLQETLNCLSDYLNRQIIIFTANPGIHDMFTNMQIQSNYIAI